MTDQQTAEKPFDEFTASILTAMASQSAAAHNAVTQSLEARVAETREHFAKFYDAIANANIKIDSATLDRVLWNWEWLRDAIANDGSAS